MRCPVSAETRRKMSAAATGERNPMWGKPISDEHREKLRAAKLGTHRGPHSEERREKIGAAQRGDRHYNYGGVLSAEHRAKISAALKGKPRSPETRAKLVGANTPNWRGGISFEPYCVKFNRGFKERVREFFGRRCAECDTPENGYKLHIHHVNYRKDACCDEDAIPLFVPLCRSCHCKTNFNRDYWEARFTALINERYCGRCYLPKESVEATFDPLAPREETDA